MITRFLIVVLTFFVILWEVSSLKCYVCQNCPPDSGNYSEVQTKDNCSSCVIEDKFDYHKYLQTDRSCEICPQNNLVVENVNRSFYHCCNNELCLGSERDGLQEINRTAKNIEKQRTVKIKSNGKISSEIKHNSESTSEVKVQTMKPTPESSTQNLESLSTTTQSMRVMKQEHSTQPSDTTNLSAGTTAANAAKASESTTDPESTNALSPTLPTKSLDSAIDPSKTTIVNITTVATRKKEETQEHTKETEDEIMTPPADTVSQNLENVSTESDQSRDLNTEVPKKHSDSADMQNEANTNKPNTVTGGRAKISVPTSADEVESVMHTTETATQIPTDQSSVLGPQIPTKPTDTAGMSDKATTTKNTPVARGEEVIREPTIKSVEESMEKPTESATQNLESLSIATCQTSVWYLSFSIFLICGLVDALAG